MKKIFFAFSYLLVLVFSAGIYAQAVSPSTKIGNYTISAVGDFKNFKVDLSSKEIEKNVTVLKVKLSTEQEDFPPAFSLKWDLPSVNIAGVWVSSNAGIRDRIWSTGSTRVESMLARQAPVLTLLGHGDNNRLTFASSDAINTIVLTGKLREEDGLIYCSIDFFREKPRRMKTYEVDIRIDNRDTPYYKSLEDVADWWTTYKGYEPAVVPDVAKLPVYSTWYSYHQIISEEDLLKECEISAKMGFGSIIIDDGWQTLDSKRGYAFTGDWKPERLTKIKQFVDDVHKLGMKVMLWYSLPFVGTNSENYKKFDGKYLSYRSGIQAGVLDPRYPEVREFIISTYKNAMQDWNLDGFKLDFIDNLQADDSTVLTAENGRDYASVNEAVDRLMTDIIKELKAINPEIMIEFRQAYIGPLMRKYGNMFRAADCPNASISNRVRTTDVKLICGNTAVHADMIMWRSEEPVEYAAFQYSNIMFSVPQISVKLNQVPADHLQMIDFYSKYWIENREILLNKEFAAHAPLLNYPVISSSLNEKQIFGIYGDIMVNVDKSINKIDFINAKGSETVYFKLAEDFDADINIFNCKGEKTKSARMKFKKGINEINAPISGIVQISKVK